MSWCTPGQRERDTAFYETMRSQHTKKELPITLCETVVTPTGYRIFSTENKSINSHRASKLEYLTAIKEDGMP